MRVLVIGYPLPNANFDNYSFVSAPSFFDYDAIVVDPANITRVVDDALKQVEELNTFNSQPVVNAPTTPVGVGLAEQLLRRIDETSRFLAKGGLVVCFLRPNMPHTGVIGFPGCDRYYWLPAPSGVIYGATQLVPGEGFQSAITDPAHPFARYFESQRSAVRYHAYWVDDRVPHFAVFGRVFARSVGGAALGVEFKIGGGRIVFLPSADGLYSNDSRYDLAQTVFSCIEQSLIGMLDEPEPGWVAMESLPGLASLLETEERELTRLTEAEAGLAAARSAREELSKYRRLLWQEGKFGLEAIIRDSLQVIGFSVSDNLDEPGTASSNGEAAFIEVEGAAEAVEMAPHYRLRQRREDELQKSGRYVKGLVVVNGYRRQAIAERPQQFSDALRVAAESTRFCLLTTGQLFDLVKQRLENPEERQLSDIRSALLATEGEYQHDAPVSHPSSLGGTTLDERQQP